MARATKPLKSQGGAFREGPPKHRTPLRDNLEWIAFMVLVVLLARQTVVEAFRIRHGSMAPTLLGTHQELRCPNCGWTFNVGLKTTRPGGDVECPNCRYYWDGAARDHPLLGPITFPRPEWLWNTGRTADGAVIESPEGANRVYRGPSRIFVNKFLYRVRKPRRWEVVVFLYRFYAVRCKTCDWEGETESLEGFVCRDCGDSNFEVSARDFIKRVVGLPDEAVSLKDGDVYINGLLERKPRHVQKDLWFHVFDSRFMPKEEVVPLFDLGGTRWQRVSEGGVLAVDARGAAEPSMAAFAPRILDLYPYGGPSYDRAPRRLAASGRHEVGDSRIRAKVRLLEEDAAGGEVVLEVSDAGHSFTLSVSAGANGAAVLRDNGEVVRTTSMAAPLTGESTWLTLENYDDRVVARAGGKELFVYDYQGQGGGRRGVRFGARGATVLWERIVIERDIHYIQPEAGPRPTDSYQLGPAEYFVLGDNSPASSDSRHWDHPGVRERNLIGKAFFVFWPVHRVRWL